MAANGAIFNAGLRCLNLSVRNLYLIRRPRLLSLTNCGKQSQFHTSRIAFKLVPYTLSDIGEGIVEVVVKEWYVKQGDTIAQFDPVCEVQSDKASVTITSRYDGKVAALRYEVDQIAKVGEPLLDIVVPDKESTEPVSTEQIYVPPNTQGRERIVEEIDKALATPAVRRIARETNTDLKEVSATGKAGRVLKEDILAYLAAKTTKHKPLSVETEKVVSGPDNYSIEEISGFKKTMEKTMSLAWKIPHFTYSDEVDVSALVQFRGDSQRLDSKAGVRVTPLSFLLKATSLALLQHPRLNAVVDENCTKLTIHKNHNLGVAIDSPSGLIVPNIKRVEQLSVIEIAKELARLQALARDGRLAPLDLQGGTLTLSNIGAIGGTVATPIILPPQIVIGALGKFQRLPRFNEEGQIVAMDIMSVSWSADHRVVDGAAIARFSNLFKLYIASPQLLIQL